MQMTNYEPGQFCWVELSTNDTAAAKAFYGELFGWTYDEMPMDVAPYIIAKKSEASISASTTTEMCTY